MTPAALLATALGLSSDAFAAAVARGGRKPSSSVVGALKVGAVFGLCEGSMCLLGWVLAAQFAVVVTLLDHWLALLILGAIGLRMIHAGVAGSAPAPATVNRRGLGTVLTALGTSVDAAAVGVALAFIEVDVWAAVATIGLTSFVISSLGYFIGPRVGRRLGRWAEVVGGAVLVTIGVLIFLSHSLGG